MSTQSATEVTQRKLKGAPEVVDIHHSKDTQQIIIPARMTVKDAFMHFKRRILQDDAEVGIDHTLQCYALDGAYALHRAMCEMFGWANLIPTPGIFGDTPPTMVSVEVEPGHKVQVPWGRIEVPDIEGYLCTACPNKRPGFNIGGVVKRKDEAKVLELCRRTEELVRTESIYGNRAVRLDLGWMSDPERSFNIETDSPKFIDTTRLTDLKIALNTDVQQTVDFRVLAPIQKTRLFRSIGVPLKTGILLYGPPGCGKTLLSSIVAREAVNNGWTFILLKDARNLSEAIRFAKAYQPVVVFCEDIDRVLCGERDFNMDEILNTIDGVESKNSEIMFVFTTNDMDRITEAARRPGRLDACVHIAPPDATAVEELLHLYGRNYLKQGDDFSKVAKDLSDSGNIPAMIREIVERAKIAAAIRESSPNIVGKIEACDIGLIAQEMAAHMDLLRIDNIEELPPLVQAAEVLGESVDKLSDALTLGNAVI